ncbi:MAG: hypothetical protein PHE83_11075 [Opitutaceae bacterium]|nr:hypothetical protein [Opitutaceae bacterium]
MKDDPSMRGLRCRNESNGRLREKRGDTHVGTIERRYDVNLGARADMHLDTLLRQRGYHSLNDLLHSEK